MNILHIDSGREWRGGQRQVLLLLRGLAQRGHHVELLAPPQSPLAERAAAAGIAVHVAGGALPRAAMARKIRSLLRHGTPAVVHAHDAHALTAAWMAGAHLRTALVASRRVAYPLHSGPFGLARYRAAHTILAVSQFVARIVVDSGIPSRQVQVVYDGVALPAPCAAAERSAARARWNVASGEVLLGCVGYLLPEKGQEAIVRVLALLHARHPEYKLLLAGGGPLHLPLKKLARDLGMEAQVIFPGIVRDVESVYRALDVFLFPSLAEPLGSSLLDAMAYGLPAIAVASGGVPEIITHGENGLLIAEPRAELFAPEILRLRADSALAARLAAAGRATIAARFTADRMVEETLRACAALGA